MPQDPYLCSKPAGLIALRGASLRTRADRAEAAAPPVVKPPPAAKLAPRVVPPPPPAAKAAHVPVVRPPPPWRASVHKPPAGPPPAHLLVKPDAGVLNILLILLWYFAHSTLNFSSYYVWYFVYVSFVQRPGSVLN